jgi:hypothetical protein
MELLYGRAGRLAAQNGVARPGQVQHVEIRASNEEEIEKIRQNMQEDACLRAGVHECAHAGHRADGHGRRLAAAAAAEDPHAALLEAQARIAELESTAASQKREITVLRKRNLGLSEVAAHLMGN